LVDYRSQPRPATRPGSRRLLWFGHTTRGNFESARWILDYLSSQYGYRPVLVTAPASMKHRYPTYAPYCVPWSIETLTREMAQAELCVVSHATEEPTKSPNRFVTATMRGVPTIISNSPACFEILQAAGHGEFAVANPSDLDRVLELLSNPERRHSYVYALQEEMWRRHGPDTVRQAYLDLFDKVLPSNSDY
jgi:glycosyltransferase involved in cell wall biosynthesis